MPVPARLVILRYYAARMNSPLEGVGKCPEAEGIAPFDEACHPPLNKDDRIFEESLILLIHYHCTSFCSSIFIHTFDASQAPALMDPSEAHTSSRSGSRESMSLFHNKKCPNAALFPAAFGVSVGDRFDDGEYGVLLSELA